MKIKKGFAKREIAGSNIVVPVGARGRDFNGMITLNDSASFFWDCLSKDTTPDKIVDAVVAEYEVDRATAQADVEKFLNLLRENNLLDE